MIVSTAALATIWAGAALGKAATARIEINGPGIAGTIASTDRDAIAPNVWVGDFAVASRPVDAPAALLPRYRVQSHIALGDGRTRLAYVVQFVWDPVSGRAVVRLPGPGEDGFRLNVGTILHDGSDGSELRDGRWYEAAEDWGRSIRLLLPVDQRL
jgi:hypothetical protein